MRLFISIALFSLLSFDSSEKIRFNETNFKLILNEGAEGLYSVKEYIPEGETETYYFQKISVLINSSDTDIDVSVKNQIKEFADRKKKDPSFKYVLTQDADHSIYIFDYISKKVKDSMIDFNLLKFSLSSLKGKTAVCMTSYRMRGYGSEEESFLKYIKEMREQYLEQIKALNISL
jgi:hypothetical protein